MKIGDLVNSDIRGLWGEEPTESNAIPVIKTNNMTYEGIIDYSDLTLRSIDKEKFTKNCLKKGDLIIEKSGGTKTHSVGYVNYFDGEDDKYVTNNFILVLRPNKDLILPKYLFYVLKYKYENGHFYDCYNKTTGIQNLQVKTYLSKEIEVPPFEAQQKVIDILDNIQSQIILKREQISVLKESVNSQFEMMFGNVSECKPLSELTKKITDGSHLPPKGIEKSEYMMLSSQNVFDELILDDVRFLTKDDFEKENKRTDIECGDVLLTIVGTIGRTHVVKENEKFVFQRSVGVIKPMFNVLNGTFLAAYLETSDAKSQLDSGGHGSSQKGIYLQDLKKLLIPMVDFSKQLEFENIVNQHEKAKKIIADQISNLTELFNSKMSEYCERE